MWSFIWCSCHYSVMALTMIRHRDCIKLFQWFSDSVASQEVRRVGSSVQKSQFGAGYKPDADVSHEAQIWAPVLGLTGHAATSPAYPASMPMSHQRRTTLKEAEKTVNPQSQFALQLLGIPCVCSPLFPDLITHHCGQPQMQVYGLNYLYFVPTNMLLLLSH